MEWKPRVVVVGVAMSTLFLVTTEDASACVCAISNIGIEGSHAVFLGRATSSEYKDSDTYVNVTVYTFEVESAWKGVKSREVSIRTDSVCHAYFEIDVEYIVYASREEGFQLATDICYRNVRLRKESGDVSKAAQKHLNSLGKPTWSPQKKR